MTCIKTFSSRLEAEIARGLLEQAGIMSLIQADDQGGMRPSMAFASGVRLLVAEDRAQEAREVLAQK